MAKVETIWCVRYWNTKGIYPVKGIIAGDMCYPHCRDHKDYILTRGNWARTELEAREMAEKYRQDRMASLKGKLQELEKLKF